ncbi:MAG: hypothetical protein IT275_07120 [Chitinophagales bacterium]|nr:hypothetical protein [Chitinophagales bacterium]
MFSTLIICGCKKVDSVKQSSIVSGSKTIDNSTMTLGQNSQVPKFTEQTKNNLDEVAVEDVSETDLDVSNPFIKRIMNFDKLDYEKRAIIANSLTFKDGILTGVSGI